MSMLTFDHHYTVIQRAGKWYIAGDDGSETATIDEAGARISAAMWNAWGSWYDQRNPKCHEPLPQEIHQLWVTLRLFGNHQFPCDEEDEDRVGDDEPKPQTLWQ
jgi:hypothetical protein